MQVNDDDIDDGEGDADEDDDESDDGAMDVRVDAPEHKPLPTQFKHSKQAPVKTDIVATVKVSFTFRSADVVINTSLPRQSKKTEAVAPKMKKVVEYSAGDRNIQANKVDIYSRQQHVLIWNEIGIQGCSQGRAEGQEPRATGST